jgi:hypothetical protein
LVIAAIPAFAQFTPVSTPAGSYTSSTTLLAITPPNGTSLSSLTDGTQTVSLSTALSAQTVPGGGWSTWGAPPNTESSTPRVLARYSALTSLTLTLSVPATTFGFEIEPNTFAAFSITATFLNGATTLGSVTRTVNGSAGALLAAASSTTPITSVELTVPSGANGFAIAQLRYSTASSGPTAIPTLNTAGMCGLGMLLAAAGAMLARKQQMI